MRRTRFWHSLLGIMLAAAALSCAAQTYPTRPVRLLIPFPPGGGADINGRLIGKALTDRWGVQIVVDTAPARPT
jgi:tripartite-type tricarboxylate transporter receptor subunit TctC